MNHAELNRVIRAAAITYSRSGGPGGQRVNKVSTKAALRLRLGDLEGGLSEAELARVRQLLDSRITGADELVITSSEERSQRINLERAFARMEALITAAAALPKRRRAARPNRAAREERLRAKRLHSRKKSSRRFSERGDEGGL